MKTLLSVNEMQSASLAWRREGRRVGFVPTMGFLHEGHLSLIRAARRLADVVVVSIFVNPTQFGPGEDLGRYPRDLDRDSRLCGDAGVDVLFCPSADDMYASGHSVYIDEGRLSSGLCGRSRPGHFRGVATVVAKLFNIVQPDVAVFGQKDAQQARLIQQMVADLNFPVRIVVAPTIREPDGLAMSSRNTYLSVAARARATAIHRGLRAAEDMFAGGERRSERLKHAVCACLEGAPPPIEVDYVELTSYRTLHPVEEVREDALLAVAVRIEGTRLLDNVVLKM
jgi:pantoate--beta-alanine ligase